MEFRPQQAIEVLERTPTALRSMLSGLSEPWVMNNYGPETFSPFDVLGHLIHGERDDWIPRAKIILQHGQDRPFDPFDRYVMYEVSKGKTIGELLDTFESLRRDNIATLKGFALTPAQLSLKGTHPELGPVTMGAVLAMWVVHDLGHIAQIAKAMAFQYREEIGPWLADTAILRGTTAQA